MTAFPVYACKEWQCRFVFDDKRCCGLKVGHIGQHQPATTGAVDPIPTVPAQGQQTRPKSHWELRAEKAEAENAALRAQLEDARKALDVTIKQSRIDGQRLAEARDRAVAAEAAHTALCAALRALPKHLVVEYRLEPAFEAVKVEDLNKVLALHGGKE